MVDFLPKEDLKAFVLDNDLDVEYSRAHKEVFKSGSLSPLMRFMVMYGEDITKTAQNISHARLKRALRCRQKIGSLVLSGDAYFLTLTFNDATLGRSDAQHRRRYVQRFLKRIAPFFVANVDYGDKKKNPDSNEREHYHALIGCYDIPDMSYWVKNYGFAKVRKVGDTEKDLKKVSKYTAKLSAHALKASTSNDGKVSCPRLIYSRNAV